LSSFALLITLFYAEEDWRGKRAWEKCKAELEAKGEMLDWSAYIPPPVPDDQNFFKAPKMADWFIKPKPGGNYSNELTSSLSTDSFAKQNHSASSATIAELTIEPDSASNAVVENADIVLRYDPFGPAVFTEDGMPENNVPPVSSTDTNNLPIQFQDVPITTVIATMARLSGVKYTLDPDINWGKTDQNGQITPEPTLSIRWENVTPRQVLEALLDAYGLQLVEKPQTGIALITIKSPNTENAVVPNTSFPFSNNELRMPIEFEDVPVTTAIESLAHLLGINYLLDPKIGYGFPDQNGQIKPEPTITHLWRNTPAREVLLAILNKYDLRLIYDPQTTIARITTKNPDDLRFYAPPVIRERLIKLFADAIGTNAISPQQLTFLVHPPNEIKPVEIVFRSDTPPTAKEMMNFLTEFFPNSKAKVALPRIQVESDGTNAFRAILDSASAADYLAWGDRFEPDLDLIREALQRPYARMDGDYSKPYEQPIPNFMAVRILAQTLAARAQCYLLLGQPDKALHELTLLHDMCRLLEAAPTGKPMTLVAAMINVAVTGLYVDTITEGIRLQEWQEPQLIALQKQLAEINLTPFVLQALQEEPAAICRDLEIMPLHQLMNFGSSSKWPDNIGSWLWPRGWSYQNMVNVAMLELKPLDGFDLARDTVAPRKIDEALRDVNNYLSYKSPFTPFRILAAIAIPNFSKAEQTTAHNQTMVNEAQIVCALERYHLAHGEYPASLDALTPQFIGNIPHDIIGGTPLIYRPTAGGKFALYSIGWNETDDGGQAAPPNQTGGIDYSKGDWVWKN